MGYVMVILPYQHVIPHTLVPFVIHNINAIADLQNKLLVNIFLSNASLEVLYL